MYKILIGIVLIIGLAMCVAEEETPEQQAARQAARQAEIEEEAREKRLKEEAIEEKAREKRLEEEAKAAAEVLEKRNGFHCLSPWNGSHRGVVSQLKVNLRDPGSFDHIETRITPVNDEGVHTLFMKYRAKNGFGGMTIGEATAIVSNKDCSAVLLAAN